MSRESGMLNSMTESSFSLLFSRSSSSCNKNTRLSGTEPWDPCPRTAAPVPSQPASPCAGSHPGGSRSCREGSRGCSRSAPPPSHRSPAEKRVHGFTPPFYTQLPGCTGPVLQPFLVLEAAATVQDAAVNGANAACSDLPAPGKQSLAPVSQQSLPPVSPETCLMRHFPPGTPQPVQGLGPALSPLCYKRCCISREIVNL